MKSIYFSIFLGLLIIASSCKDPGYTSGPNLPVCTWTTKESISVEPVTLKAPSGMSDYYYAQIPGDKIIRNLQQTLWNGNFKSSSNVGRIKGELIADGTTCKNTLSKTYNLGPNSSDIGQNFLKLNVPTQGFFGLAKMEIRSDDYKVKNAPGKAEYVLWVGSSSNPDFPSIHGNIAGVRKSYTPATGTVGGGGGSGCYYLNG